MAEKSKAGRKPLPANEKKKQKSVYISDDTEKQVLKKTKSKDLTEVITKVNDGKITIEK